MNALMIVTAIVALGPALACVVALAIVADFRRRLLRESERET